MLVHNCWSHRGVLPDLMRNILQKNVQGVQFTNVGFKQPPKGGTWLWQLCPCFCIIFHVLTAQEKDYQELEEEGGDADDGEHEEVGDQEGAASVLQREKNETLVLRVMLSYKT